MSDNAEKRAWVLYVSPGKEQKSLERTFRTCFTLSEADGLDNDKVMPVNLGVLHWRGEKGVHLHHYMYST